MQMNTVRQRHYVLHVLRTVRMSAAEASCSMSTCCCCKPPSAGAQWPNTSCLWERSANKHPPATLRTNHRPTQKPTATTTDPATLMHRYMCTRIYVCLQPAGLAPCRWQCHGMQLPSGHTTSAWRQQRHHMDLHEGQKQPRIHAQHHQQTHTPGNRPFGPKHTISTIH
jgi:hypothetical protein